MYYYYSISISPQISGPKKKYFNTGPLRPEPKLDQLPIYALSLDLVFFSLLINTVEYVEKETVVGFSVGALVRTVVDLETTPNFS